MSLDARKGGQESPRPEQWDPDLHSTRTVVCMPSHWNAAPGRVTVAEFWVDVVQTPKSRCPCRDTMEPTQHVGCVGGKGAELPGEAPTPVWSVGSQQVSARSLSGAVSQASATFAIGLCNRGRGHFSFYCKVESHRRLGFISVQSLSLLIRSPCFLQNDSE